MNTGGDGEEQARACGEEQASAHSGDNPSGAAGPRRVVQVRLDPMEMLLGLLMCQGRGSDWYKAERVSRRKLEEKYPTACRFRKTDGNIAAIDFGTTFCSLAFATAGDPDLVNMQQVEINTLKLNKYYPRVPTAILLKEAKSAVRDSDDDPVSKTCDYEVVAFGYDAVSRHSALKPKERSEHLYFERFKMTLQQDEAVHRNMTTKSSNGRKFYLVEVIAFVLKYLKTQLECHLKNTVSALKGGDFDWVITVPAIWKARGKRMMREAAYMAGLTSADEGITCFLEVGKGVPRPKEVNPDKLTLALEPEAAAIYCQTMGKEQVAQHCQVAGPLQSDRYIIIDIGGGTVDVTVHHHDHEKGVKVIIPPVGNNCGGTMVNQQFAKFLQGIVDDIEGSGFTDDKEGSGFTDDKEGSGFTRFLDSSDSSECAHKVAVLNELLYQDFELQKVAFGSSTSGYDTPESLTGAELAIKLPYSFTQFYGIDKIRAGVEALHDERVQFEDDTLYIEPSKFVNFFEPAIKGILGCIEGVFGELREQVDTIYLVGGFGGCKYTYEKVLSMVRDKFQDWERKEEQLRVIVPDEHKLAVAHGAVKYRLKPDIIHSRTMDASYGTDFAPTFNPLLHLDMGYVGMDHTGTLRVRDVYMKYVEKGEHISSDEVVTAEFGPLHNSTTAMEICIYSSFEKGVKYINTPDGKPIASIRKIGELHVDMPNPENLPREQRMVELTMDFSHTEIQIRARYIVTGEEVKVVADFLTAQVSQ